MTPDQTTIDVKTVFKTVIGRNAARPFMIDAASGLTLTFAQTHSAAAAVARRLDSLGLRRGDRVAVLSNDPLPACVFYFGCIYSGLVSVPLSPTQSEGQLRFVLQDSQCKALFASREALDGLPPGLVQGLGLPLWQFSGFGSVAGPGFSVLDLASDGGAEDYPSSGGDEPMLMVYTSATTANPKGVLHRGRSLLENGRAFIEASGIARNSRFLSVLPVTYLGGYYNLLLIPFLAESGVVLARPFAPQAVVDFWESARRYEVDTLWLVPTIIAMLLRMDRGDFHREYKKRIRLTLCGTAPLPPALRKSFEERYGAEIVENYGLTETLFVSTSRPGATKAGVGRPLAGVEVRVESPSIDVDDVRQGEISVRTPALMLGYGGGRPEIPGEWFATGDVGYVDADGSLHITGRKKDLIIRGGVNVSPAAVENVLSQHPAVVEPAVVGVPDPILGEEIAAALQVEAGADWLRVVEELRTRCRKALSTSQQPARYVRLEDLPRTPSGKVQKAKIRAWLNSRGGPSDAPPASPPASQLPPPAAYFRPAKVVADCAPALSVKFNNEMYELKRQGRDIITLSLGEAFFDIPLMPFDDLPFPDLYHYSHSRGIPELRERLADYFRHQYEVEFNPETEILVTAGSKVAIYMAMLAVLNPGDEALIFEPAWVSYPEQVKLCHGVPVMVPHTASPFETERFITNRTKAIVINNPQNPSGRVYSLDELTHLYRLAEKYNLFIISDEAYSDFVADKDDFVSIGNLDRTKRHLILVNSISKNYGISGWRLGYLVSSEPMISQILKLNQHLVTCAPTVLQHYIARHFYTIIRQTKPQIAALIEKRRAVERLCADLGLACLPGTSTFYLFVAIAGSKLDSDTFCRRLMLERGVCVVPGSGYGPTCDGFVRVAVGTEPLSRVEEGLRRLRDFLRETASR